MISIKELSKLAAKHKLVPFLGAGCSINHLNYDWNGIRDELIKETGFDGENHLEVAQGYIEHFGKDKFCEFLEDKLIIDGFDDEKGFSILAVMSLGLGIIYTTNQDNLIENCFEKYGRSYSKIVEVNDLAKSDPGERLIFKYHGDLSQCNSIVFSKEDYENRIADEDHFLNIRLKSDLLAKSLLFIGYSFRDENIQFIFNELKTAFKGELPPAYLIAWEYSEELAEICGKYNVELIDPLKIFPDAESNVVAFELLLKELVESTFMIKSKASMELLRSTIPLTNRIITKFEIDALNRVVDEKDFDTSIDKFRELLDVTTIPIDFEYNVVDIFKKLAKKCSNSDESEKLDNAAFNLHISDGQNRFEILIYLMITANVRDSIFQPIVQGIEEKYSIIAVPTAIKHLIDLERPITNIFRQNISRWVERSVDIEDFDTEQQEHIKNCIDKAWEGSTLENPLERKKRLKKDPIGFRARSYDEIFSSLMDRTPKTTKRPFEE